MDSWPIWEEKIIAYSRIEAESRRVINDTLRQLEEKKEEVIDVSG